MQVKPRFRMRKPRSWLTLGGCFLVQFVLRFFFVCCLFVIAPRTVFYRFSCHFEHIFDPICGVCWSKVEVTFFATVLRKTMILKVSGFPFFSIFLQSFPHSIPDLIFMVFLVILGSPRLPFWSLWALFLTLTKNRKKAGDCMGLYAGIGYSLCPPRRWADAGVGIGMLRGISLLSAN